MECVINVFFISFSHAGPAVGRDLEAGEQLGNGSAKDSRRSTPVSRKGEMQTNAQYLQGN